MLIKAGILSILITLRCPLKSGNGYRVKGKPLVAGIELAPVVQRLDNAIHRINRYPVDKC